MDRLRVEGEVLRETHEAKKLREVHLRQNFPPL